MFAPTEGPAISIPYQTKLIIVQTLNLALSAQEERNVGNKPVPFAGACRGSAVAQRRALANLMD